MIYVVIGPNCWGSGATLSVALQRARSLWPNYRNERLSAMPYVAFEATEDFTVSEVDGSIQATKLTPIRRKETQ